MSKRTKISGRENSNKAGYLFVFPYALLFTIFILTPVILAIILSFTNFNTIQFPEFVGFLNYINLITGDEVFMQYVLPNTITYALIVGVGGYVLAFLMAWALANLPRFPDHMRSDPVFAHHDYRRSYDGAVEDHVYGRSDRIFQQLADGSGRHQRTYYLAGKCRLPASHRYYHRIVEQHGRRLLSILAGILNTDESLYEAAAIDGVKNRFQEMFYVTIPSMKPQMLFAAVMQIVGAFQNGQIASMLAGNPTPGYAAQLIVNHIEDYGFIRYEMGYAAAVSVALLLIVQVFSKISTKLFGED